MMEGDIEVHNPGMAATATGLALAYWCTAP